MKKLIIVIAVFIAATCPLAAQESGSHRDVILFENKGFIFTSYMRVGAHMNSEVAMIEGGGNWNVAGGYNGMRFMNESNYSEWLLAYESPRDDPSWWGGAYLRVAYDIPDFSTSWLNTNDAGIILPEAFFRLGFAHKDWNFWLGRRYNDNIGIGMLDYYVANLDGNGVGMENIPLGDASMDANWLFSYDKEESVYGDNTTFIGKQTLAFVIKDVPVGDHVMRFTVAPSFMNGNTTDGGTTYAAGAGGFVAARYLRDCFFGMEGASEFYISAGYGTGANQKTDTDLNNYGWDDWSAIAGYQGHTMVNDTFSFKTGIHYEHRSFQTVDNPINDWLSFGFRPMVKVAPIFALQFEYDLEVAFTTGDMVNRISFAPTFMPPGGSVQSNLQVMPYITYGYGQFNNAEAVSIGGTEHGLTWGVFGHVGF